METRQRPKKPSYVVALSRPFCRSIRNRVRALLSSCHRNSIGRPRARANLGKAYMRPFAPRCNRKFSVAEGFFHAEPDEWSSEPKALPGLNYLLKIVTVPAGVLRCLARFLGCRPALTCQPSRARQQIKGQDGGPYPVAACTHLPRRPYAQLSHGLTSGLLETRVPEHNSFF